MPEDTARAPTRVPGAPPFAGASQPKRPSMLRVENGVPGRRDVCRGRAT